MDRAVLDAYGWSDILAECEFLLDHEIDEEEWGDRKRPCRYRWPDDVRDEVLSRLLELNAQRAEAERLSDESSLKKAAILNLGIWGFPECLRKVSQAVWHLTFASGMRELG